MQKISRILTPTFRRFVALMVLTAGLTACATPERPQFPELRFTHLASITLGVANIQIVEAGGDTLTGTHVENRMPRPPSEAMRNWAQDRLKANGVSGTAIFTIEEASVVGADLATTPGIKGAFTNDQAERYQLRIRATLKLEGVPRVNQAFTDTSVDRSQTVAENATINDREQIWFDMTESSMQEFNKTMEASIRQHLADFVR